MKRDMRKLLFQVSCFAHIVLDRRTQYQVMSIGDTIRSVRDKNLSIVRFGDGELTIIRGRKSTTQEYNPILAEKLETVLRTQEDGFLIAVMDIFAGGALKQYTDASKLFWMEHLFFYRQYYRRYLRKDCTYGNTFFSREYLTLRDHSQCSEWFHDLKEIWKDKKILILEGRESLNGVGNDLFAGASQISRIIVPATNCFDRYEQILKLCKSRTCDMVLLSMGAAAKPMALDLFPLGYRVLDIGNLNMEYVAYQLQIDDKAKLKEKMSQRNEQNKKNEIYKSEIVATIE